MQRLPMAAWLCLLCCAGLSLASPVYCQEPVPQRYVIDATLDPAQHTVEGRLTLVLENRANQPLNELLFHLYLNAFRDERSVFMRESGGKLRGTHSRGVGELKLHSLSIANQELLSKAERELVAGDFTQLRVPLAQPLTPGEHAEITVAFQAKLPPLFARAGYVEDFIIVAQWFPKLAKLEPNGTFAGFPYHGLGEFYADFADYDVTLHVPAEWQLGTTGEQLSNEARNGARTVRVRAQRVHDFAWVASPKLIIDKRRLAGVDVSFLALPSYHLAVDEHARVVERGLQHFGALFGSYPYPALTVVVPPRGADGGAGMEYPTLIVTDGSWLPSPGLPSFSGAIVTAHELAHQWFYGLLASDEVHHPVLDEGLSEWATLELMRAMYGPSEPRWSSLGIDRFEAERVLTLLFAKSTAQGLAAYEYGRNEYGPSVYGRASIALESVRRAFGKERFERALKLYTSANRFRHPTPRELGHAFDASYGPGFSERVLFPLLLRGGTSDVSLVSVESTSTDVGYATKVRARRSGTVSLPTWICAHDEQGRELGRVAWDERDSAISATMATKAAVARVSIDCDRALLLDTQVRDNIWRVLPVKERSLLSVIMAAAQLFFGWIGP